MSGVSGILVELLVGGTWTDITSRVMVRDNTGQISIRRGQSSEGQRPDPGTCTLELNNRNGLFSPANPMSDYYGLIGRNTQIRVSVAKTDSSPSYRFWGEVTAWPEDWDTTGNDVSVTVSAAGILRRLSQGSAPLQSTLRRSIAADADVIAYWPLEDGSASTQAASALPGGAAMVASGLSWAADDSLAGSSSLPTVTDGARLIGRVPRVTDSQAWRVEFVFKIPTAPASGAPQILSFSTTATTWWIGVSSTGVVINAADQSGAPLVSVTVTPTELFGQWMRFHVQASAGETTTNYEIGWTAVGGAGDSTTGSYTGSVGSVAQINTTFGTGLGDAAFGHVAVFKNINVTAFDNADKGFDTETVNSRLIRLCTEQGVNFAYFSPVSEDLMGPQPRSAFLALLQECVDVDQGILMERETAFGLAYKARSTLYNQTPGLTLSYTGHQLSDVPRPVPDDQTLRNDVTASRPSGSSARYVLESGPLSVLDPPDGVGVYPDTPTLNVPDDDELEQRAAWRVHLGTVNEPRYPAISVNLNSAEMSELRDDALNVLFGSRIVVEDPPGRLGGDISQVVIGITETITHFEHRITFVGQPESPYEVAVTDDTVLGKADTDGSQLALAVGTDDTVLSIETTAGELWTTDPAEYPISLLIAGEVVTARAAGAALDLVDGTFESGVTGWTVTGCTITASTAQVRSGAASGLLTVTGAPTLAYTRPDATHRVPVTAGTQYRTSMWVYAPAARTVAPAIDWLDASGTYLSTSSPAPTVLTAGVWTPLSATATAPAGAAYALPGPTLSSSPATGTLLYVDDLATVATGDYLTSPQSMTVRRSTNGVVKAQASGAPVHVAHPAVVAP